MFRDLMAAAREAVALEPEMREVMAPVLAARTFEDAVARAVSAKLADETVGAATLRARFLVALEAEGFREDGFSAREAVRADALAVVDRDPAAESLLDVVLYFKGFAAIVAHRVARFAWDRGARTFAKWLQGRTSAVFAVDLHPACTISKGVVFDHATGVVVGETAVVGEGCTLLHGVTLGATGKSSGDRHPKIGKHVLLGAGVSVLGNIRVGDGAKIGCGAVVLRSIPSGATAVGAPAKIVGRATEPKPAEKMDLGLCTVDAHGKAWEGACVWRDILAHRAKTAAGDVITFETFRSFLAKKDVSDDVSSDLFFQLDKNQDGLLSEAEVKLHFHAVAAKYCAALKCPLECGKLVADMCNLKNREPNAP